MESDGSELSRRTGLLSALICVLTQVFFAYDAGWCDGDVNGWGMLMILARNIALVALVWLVAKELRSRMLSADAGA